MNETNDRMNEQCCIIDIRIRTVLDLELWPLKLTKVKRKRPVWWCCTVRTSVVCVQLLQLIMKDITWHDMTWRDMTWHDITWYDVTWHHMTWKKWRDVTCRDATRRSVTWHDMTWHNMTWHGMTWPLRSFIISGIGLVVKHAAASAMGSGFNFPVVREYLRFTFRASTLTGKQCWLCAVRLQQTVIVLRSVVDTWGLIRGLQTWRSITNGRSEAKNPRGASAPELRTCRPLRSVIAREGGI